MTYSVHFPSMTDELASGLRKEAILGTILGGLGHAAATGAAGHVGANALGVAGHHGNIGELLAHRAFQHGLTGSHMGKGNEFAIKHIFGPEALASYQAAHAVGSKMKGMHTTQMRAALAAGTVGSHLSPELRNSPIVGDLGKAFEHELKGTTPELQTKGLLGKLHGKALDKLTGNAVNEMDTAGSRLMKNAPGALAVGGMGLADAAVSGGVPSGMMAHMGVNRFRGWLGNTAFGKKVMHQGFTKGLRGEQIPQWQQHLSNYVVSPGVLDPYRIGNAVHATAERMGPLAQKGVENLGNTPYGQFTNRLQGAMNSATNTAGQVADAGQAAYQAASAAGSNSKRDTLLGAGALGLGVAGAGAAAMRAFKQPSPAQPEPQPAPAPMPKAASEVEHHEDKNLFVPSKAMKDGLRARQMIKARTPAGLVALALMNQMSKKEASVLAGSLL